jgi:threonine dehydrogenase-like Zn-dependent dehydrogenase
VTDLELGDRIAALSYHGYAEFDVAQSDRVIRLPSELSGVAFPGEALGCAYNVFRRAQISAQDTVAVVGIGFIGAAVAQLAAGAGARVIGISRSESSRRTARAVGCEEALELGDAAIERVQGLTDDRLCDVVVEAAGVQATLDLAAALTRLRGRLVIAGYHQDGPRQVDMQMWNWRGLDVINAHERDPQIYREGMRLAADAVREQRLRLETLVTHSFPLEQLSEAMAAVAGGDRAIVKAVVCP